MKRRLILSLAASALAATMLPAAASAGAPIGGCPTGAEWQLIYPIHQPQAADMNGDGWLCRLDLNAGQGGPFGLGFTFFDNVVQ
jgi:hypothetical protein